jgi:hypothetical protein
LSDVQSYRAGRISTTALQLAKLFVVRVELSEWKRGMWRTLRGRHFVLALNMTMAVNDWNGLLAGVALFVMGILALSGFAWNIRQGVSGYADRIHAYYERIGNPYSDDKRGIWKLAATKLAGAFALGIIMLLGGGLLIALATVSD